MRIGIKFCGGCNPRYDRSNFVKKLVDEFNDITFESAKDNVYYDIVMVICGCSSACANHEKLIGVQKIIINEENDFNKVKKLINSELKII